MLVYHHQPQLSGMLDHLHLVQLLELVHALTQGAHHTGEPGTKQEQGHDQNDDQLWRAQAADEGELHGSLLSRDHSWAWDAFQGPGPALNTPSRRP